MLGAFVRYDPAVRRWAAAGGVLVVGALLWVWASGDTSAPNRAEQAGQVAETAVHPVQPRERMKPLSTEPKAAPPLASSTERARDRVRRRIAAELDDEDPSTWPPLPSAYFRQYMNEEIAPLITECMCELHPDDEPERIILDIRFIGVPGIGGTVDSVEPGEGNQLEQSDELMQCIRESAYSADLPPPEERGAKTITMRASGCNSKGQAASD